MVKVKEDRRIRITKKAIKESLIELLQEYPIAKISVKMICESADINRSTFYAHYNDQSDLLGKLQEETVENIREYTINKFFITGQNEIAIPVLTQILEHAKENRILFQVLLSDHCDNNFQKELISFAKEKTLEELDEYVDKSERIIKYIELFEIAGILCIMQEWLSGGCVEEPDQLAEMIAKLLFQGASAFYK